MNILQKWTQKNRYTLLFLIGIISLGFFFRTYHLVGRYEFAHDGDLSSWFIKDVVVDHHIRLIGQLTSAPGIFIGPAFYYALIPFYLLFNMDPLGGNLLVIILALATLLSYYLVFSRLFNSRVGLIITFLQAVLLYHANFDRAVVPTTPTHLWSVWYFYSLIQISRRQFKIALPLLGFLIGYIWHLHVALAPAFLALPLAFIYAKKLPPKKTIFYFLLTLLITFIPLILFEARHNFSQTLSFVSNLSDDHGGGKGLYKMQLVMLMISKNITYLFLYPFKPGLSIQIGISILLILISIALTIKKMLPPKIALLSALWILGMIIFFTISSTPISEYYFANFEIIFLLVAALLINSFYTVKMGKYFAAIILGLLLIYNLHGLLNWSDAVAGYVSRKSAIDFIRRDMSKNSYDCISLNYIAIIGENVGFRYFLWKNNIQVVKASKSIPNYQIVIPAGMSDEVTHKNGLVGVIPPSNSYQKPDNLKEECGTEDLNLTNSMFGFVK